MKVELGDAFTDERGVIQNVVALRSDEEPIRGVAIITSKAGSVRSRHRHILDSHRLYVLSGSLEYFERPQGSNETPRPHIYRSGEMFWTGPNTEHAVRFLEDTTLLSLSPRPRDHQSHEEDVVRVDFRLPGE